MKVTEKIKVFRDTGHAELSWHIEQRVLVLLDSNTKEQRQAARIIHKERLVQAVFGDVLDQVERLERTFFHQDWEAVKNATVNLRKVVSGAGGFELPKEDDGNAGPAS